MSAGDEHDDSDLNRLVGSAAPDGNEGETGPGAPHGEDAPDAKEEFLEVGRSYLAEEINTDELNVTTIGHATNVIIGGTPRVSPQKLASYPTARWYAECVKLSVWHQWYVNAIAFLPNAPFLKLEELIQKLVQQTHPAVRDEMTDRILAEIGVQRRHIRSAITNQRFDAVTFAQTNIAPAEGRAQVQNREDARAYIWRNSKSSTELRNWLIGMGQSSDAEFAVRSGTSIGWLVCELENDHEADRVNRLLADVIDVWALAGGHARRALAAAMLEIEGDDRAYQRVKERLERWTRSAAKTDELKRVVNFCRSDWALRDLDYALTVVYAAAANRNLDKHPGLANDLRRAVERIWLRGADRAGADNTIAQKAIAFFVNWNEVQPRAAMPFWWFAGALRAELEARPLATPSVLRWLNDGTNAATEIALLFKNGLNLEKAQKDLADTITALRAHAAVNGEKDLFDIFIEDLKRAGVITPKGLVPELDPPTAPPPPPPPRSAPASAAPTYAHTPPPPSASSSYFRPSSPPPNPRRRIVDDFEEGQRDARVETRRRQATRRGHANFRAVSRGWQFLDGVAGVGVRLLVGALVVLAGWLVISNTHFDVQVANPPPGPTAQQIAEQTSWSEAQASPSLERLHAFVTSYPSSEHRSAALTLAESFIVDHQAGQRPASIQANGPLWYRAYPSYQAPAFRTPNENGWYNVYAMIEDGSGTYWYVFRTGGDWPFTFVAAPRPDANTANQDYYSPSPDSSSGNYSTWDYGDGTTEGETSFPTGTTEETQNSPPRLIEDSTHNLDRYYPDRARERGDEGEARVAILVSASGEVLEVNLLSETPRGQGFGAAALRYARTLRFEPAIRSSVPQTAWCQRTIHFKLAQVR